MPAQPTAESNTKDTDALRGLVFDIKRFALHDGPGIRTTAFLKGCPLRCPWCQNPEGIDPKPILWYTNHQCIKCRACVAACPNGALSAHPESDRFIHIDRTKCDCDGSCVAACPTGALHWDSKAYTVDELVDVFDRDRVFYESSGGGITLSGGEPLYLSEYARAVLIESKNRGLHTALETTLFTSPSVLGRVLPFVDHFLTDIKIWDRETHKSVVGVDNEPILRNIRHIAELGKTLTVRIPLIPGITNTEENIAPTAAFVAGLPGDVPLELINFNPLASGKYLALDQDYDFASYTSPLPADEVDHLKTIARERGATVI